MKEVARVGNKIYFIEANVVKETDTKSWEDAVSFCNGKNLNLASFLNQEQFDGLYKWHKTFGPSGKWRFSLNSTDSHFVIIFFWIEKRSLHWSIGQR